MTQTQQHCSTPDHLLTFLRGQLSSQEESELQLHLNDCVLCRERLENAAADADAWNEARQFFGTGASHGSTEDSTGGHEETTQGSQRIRQMLDTLAPTDDPESLGRIGGYEVTGVVGAGGMGVVLKAHDRSLDRIVAVKVMSPHLASSGSARKRFAREAKAAAAVLHPNVIAIHSVASEDANPFLVMPYVRGESLQKRIDSQGPLPLKDTLRIAAQIAAGLAAAHEQGLVHRDIKPANILLEEGVERVTITDFGLARAVDDASMTCSGVIAGTPQYMSPEQTRGEPIDARSDLFSLGSVLYAMCAGRSPFRAETTYGVLHRIANDNPTSVCEVNSDVPEWLGRIIERLMAKRAEDRFESADQVAELLEDCLAYVQQPSTAPLPEALVVKPESSFSSLPLRKIGVYVMFAVVSSVILSMLLVQPPENPPQEDAISNNERLIFDPQYVNPDIEKYIKVKVHKSVDVVIPLDAAIYTNELMKANVGHSLLSLTAHDVVVRTSVDGPFFKADSVYAHFCRLQSYEADVVNGKKVWLAKFTIPLAYSRTGTRKVQVIEADGKAVWKTEDGEQHYDQQVSQEEIDRLLKDSVQFRLAHYQGQPPRQVPIVKGRSAPKTYTDSGFNFGKLEQSGGMGAIDEQSKPEELSQTEQPPVELSPAEQALSELEAESNQLWSAYQQASEDAADDVELNRVYEQMDPRHLMPSKYLAMEEKYRGTDEGLKALVQVCSMARSVAGANSPAGKGRREAVKRVIEHYLHREGLESIIASLGGGPWVPQADELLQALVEKSPFRKTQAEALIAQIIIGNKTLMVESQMPKVRAAVQVRMEKAPLALRDEFEQRLKTLENTDFNQLRRDLNEKLDRLANLYSDVTVDHYGTGGTAAHRLSHAINKVVIGQPAPELASTDIDGKPFRLSELRGKHVVLMFAQSVNDDYGDMYAPIRQLVAKYGQAPVRVVGIMSNADQSLLHAAAKRGDLNWTVIPQPLNGPLQLDWGIEGYPAVYIVDADGTLHPPLHMPYYGEGGYDTAEIDEAMEGLLREHYKNASKSRAADE